MTETHPALSVADARTHLLEAATRDRLDVQAILSAALVLEKHYSKSTMGGTPDGEWRLLWTSGTRSLQKLQQMSSLPPSSAAPQTRRVVQRIHTSTGQLENEVYFPVGSINVTGSFDYTAQQRIQFTFERVQLKLGTLPSLKVPLGTWARGWLQTTYLDDAIHIERGDRGGVSVFLRAAQN